MNNASAYEILGVSNKYTKNELKSAYAKQIRLHTPEKDPEGFKTVRAAYELLSSQLNEEFRPTFRDSPDPEINKLYHQLIELEKKGNYTNYLTLAKKAADIYPREDRFLYCWARAERLNGFPGKAVKQAEKLVKQDPANRWFLRERAMCYVERGYNNKAAEALKGALKPNTRDLELMVCYMSDVQNRRQYVSQIEKPFFEAMEDSQRWTEEYAYWYFKSLQLITQMYETEEDEFEDDWDSFPFSFLFHRRDELVEKFCNAERNVQLIVEALNKHIDELYGSADDYVKLLYAYFDDFDDLNHQALADIGGALCILMERCKLSLSNTRCKEMIAECRPYMRPDISMELNEYTENTRNAIQAILKISDLKKSGKAMNAEQAGYYQADAVLFCLQDYKNCCKEVKALAGRFYKIPEIDELFKKLDSFKRLKGFANLKKALAHMYDVYLANMLSAEKKGYHSAYFAKYPEERKTGKAHE